MVMLRLLFISILFFSTLSDFSKDNTTFISPVKIPLLLSANFGELRIDHYHSGLDIKTQGTIGKEVVSAADGFIYRISVSPGGFGKALYVRHASGYSTVYGHLDRFTPAIDEFVKSQQYEKKSFLVTLFPARDKFPVKQGEVIAYSGNSGSSAGPHLHYEIRKSESEIPVNPLMFDFGTGDDIVPIIDKLSIYPINRYSFINGKQSIKKIEVSGGHGNYYIPKENEIVISGLAGFGIKAYDLLNDSYNKCAVYSIELTIDSIPVFKYIMDEFSFNESRYINSHIDYETYMRENTYFERTFILPNDKLGNYKDAVNRGIFNFNDDNVHKVQITVADAHYNKSVLSFNVRSQTAKPANVLKTGDQNFKIMPYNRTNRFSDEDIAVTIPSGALYDTLRFAYKKNTGNSQMLSDVHEVHNKFTPVHKPIVISIKPKTVPAGKESKMMVVQLSDDLKKSALNSSWKEGFLTAEASSFGNFFIGIDTVPPVISSNGLVSGADLSDKKEVRIKISDDFSGIRTYEPTIDGNWVLFEYDQKNNVIIHRFDEKRIKKNSKHSLSLKVTDNKDNSSFYSCDFTW
ncbi:MAG: M23 family metallopeptidase [Bacteroidales bacterium]|nr:M23 family metallopeptidase [Bacteroidales bacterium]